MALSAEPRQFVAEMKALPDVLSFAAATAVAAGFDGVARLFVELIIEELFTNTVVHGYGGDSSKPVWVGVVRDGGNLSLTYEDAAPAFNPLIPAAPDLNVPVEERRVGGLGMPLVKALAATVSYVHEAGRNRLTLTISAHADR